jgi:hypothetical protein
MVLNQKTVWPMFHSETLKMLVKPGTASSESSCMTNQLCLNLFTNPLPREAPGRVHEVIHRCHTEAKKSVTFGLVPQMIDTACTTIVTIILCVDMVLHLQLACTETIVHHRTTILPVDRHLTVVTLITALEDIHLSPIMKEVNEVEVVEEVVVEAVELAAAVAEVVVVVEVAMKKEAVEEEIEITTATRTRKIVSQIICTTSRQKRIHWLPGLFSPVIWRST